METNSQHKFMRFVINYYRFSEITFGGVTLDKNGNIIKSKFWYHFGWFGFCFYSFPIAFFITASLSFEQFKRINSPLFLIFNITWYITSLSLIISILIIHHKYGFKISKIFIEHSLTKFTKLKLVRFIWILHHLITALIFILQSIFFPIASHIVMSFTNNIMLMTLYYSLSFISWIVSTNFAENIKIIKKYLIANARIMKINDNSS